MFLSFNSESKIGIVLLESSGRKLCHKETKLGGYCVLDHRWMMVFLHLWTTAVKTYIQLCIRSVRTNRSPTTIFDFHQYYSTLKDFNTVLWKSELNKHKLQIFPILTTHELSILWFVSLNVRAFRKLFPIYYFAPCTRIGYVLTLKTQ